MSRLVILAIQLMQLTSLISLLAANQYQGADFVDTQTCAADQVCTANQYSGVALAPFAEKDVVNFEAMDTQSMQRVRASWSSLLLYARLGMLAKGKLLVEPRLRDSAPVSLLMSAAIAEDIPTVQRLLSEGSVPVDGKNEAGETALMHAAVGGSIEAVHALLDYGADLNSQDSQGWTALMKV
jgi:hypothetical protein